LRHRRSRGVESSCTLACTGAGPFHGQPFSVPGTFQAEDFDCGGEGVAYHDAVGGNVGGLYRPNEDVDIFAAPTGLRVANFQTGEWLTYSINVAKTDNYRIELSVSSTFTNSRFHVEIDGINVTGPITVPATPDWNTFEWVATAGIQLTAGSHVLKIFSEQEYFDIDAIRVTGRTPFYGTPFAAPATFEAEDFDLGGEGIAYHDLVAGNAGDGNYRTGEDVDIFSNSPVAGLRVANFNTGEWLTYSISVAQAGAYRIELSASSMFTNSRFHLEIDGVAVTGSITVPPTASWVTFQWIGASGINLSAGTHVLKVVSEQEWFDIDALRVVQ
jgi:Carbohydrate binding module (family 6)